MKQYRLWPLSQSGNLPTWPGGGGDAGYLGRGEAVYLTTWLGYPLTTVNRITDAYENIYYEGNKNQVLFVAIILDPVVVTAKEGFEVLLQFANPGSGGPYEEIVWYKGATGSTDNRIVFVHPAATGGQPLYYNDYCSGSSRCYTSEKGQLNTTTGEFTIRSVELTDGDYYYYDFYGGGSTATGHKYEINLTVSGKRHYFNCNINY